MSSHRSSATGRTPRDCSGSDVLGSDTEQSIDHGWGPRLVVFVDAADVVDVQRVLAEGLPETYEGWPVHYGWDDVRVDHHVALSTDALLAAVAEPALRHLPMVGSVDQVSDNSDVLERPKLARRLAELYRPLG